MTEAQSIFTWSIENFFSYHLKSKELPISPEFTIDSFKGTKWQVIFSKDPYPFTCFLQRSETCVKTERSIISYGVEFIDGSSRELYSARRTVTKEFAKDKEELVRKLYDKWKILDGKSSGDDLTVRLKLLYGDFSGNQDAECIARTKICGDLYSFEWNLGEKSFPQLKTFPCFQGMQVTLEVNCEPEDSIKVVIKKTKQISTPRFLQCKISLVGVDGKYWDSKKSANWFSSEETKWDFSVPLEKDCLESNKNVTLLCRCHVSEGNLSSELKYIQPVVSAPESSVHPLQDDFQRLHLDEFLCDAKLVVDEQLFLAHKCVLCSCSPVFLAMFNKNKEEKKTNFIAIPDTKPKIFAMFLEFVYTGKTNLCNYEDALELLLCANEYHVLPLKEYCSSFLMQFLCEKNACEILIIADKADMKMLKSSAICRILAHALRIFKSADWIQLLDHHPKLTTEVLSIMSSEFCF